MSEANLNHIHAYCKVCKREYDAVNEDEVFTHKICIVHKEYDAQQKKLKEYPKLKKQINKLEAENKKLKEVLNLMDWKGDRARNLEKAKLPEDAMVKLVCDTYGYGAVMDSASRQWYLRDNHGAFLSGPCYLTVRKLMENKNDE
jgi:hypothetical protein